MQTIKDLLREENSVLIDVRNDWEYNEARINGALNIPLHEIPSQIDRIRNLKGPIIVYCRSGNRSGAAVSLLKQAGVSKAYNGGSIFNIQKILLN